MQKIQRTIDYYGVQYATRKMAVEMPFETRAWGLFVPQVHTF